MVVRSMTASRSSAEGSTTMGSNHSAQIDTLARSLAGTGSRRMLLRSVIARAVGAHIPAAVFIPDLPGSASAKRRKRSHHRPAHHRGHAQVHDERKKGHKKQK